jgi:hypothetical protein
MQWQHSGQNEYDSGCGNVSEYWPRAHAERCAKFYHLDESLSCNSFKALESQQEIGDQLTLSEFLMRAIVSLRPNFTVSLSLTHSFFTSLLLLSECRA